MTSSAPIDRTSSAFDPEATPVTTAPRAFAICTVNVPTPPPAPVTNTFVPGDTSAAWSARSAVAPEIGTAAASSKDSRGGFAATFPTGTTANSANEPDEEYPITSSPGANPVTPEPTASTTPATSPPRTRALGRRSPNASCATRGSANPPSTATTRYREPRSRRALSRSSSTPAPFSTGRRLWRGVRRTPTGATLGVRRTLCQARTARVRRPFGRGRAGGHENRRTLADPRAAEPGADPPHRRRPGRRGRRRVAQLAKDSPGDRRRCDGALQAR